VLTSQLNLEHPAVSCAVIELRRLGLAEVQRPVRGGAKPAAGSQVLSGVLRRGAFVRVLRDRQAVATGQIRDVEMQDEPVKEVGAGRECSVVIEPPYDCQAGDFLEIFELTEEGAPPPTARL
jgi:translation initiation factor IF-2